MPGRVRSIDRGYIRLSEPVRAQVEYLARLAGVATGDIVNFVLSEMLELDAAAAPPAPPVRRHGPSPRPRPRRQADVIPIARKRVPLRCAPLVELREMHHLRRQAENIRRHAQELRARAVEARSAALGARTRASDLLHGARA